MPLFYCSTCGLVRESDEAPFCRHGAPDSPANQMGAMPPGHPFAGKTSGDPGFSWLRAKRIVRADVRAELDRLAGG